MERELKIEYEISQILRQNNDFILKTKVLKNQKTNETTEYRIEITIPITQSKYKVGPVFIIYIILTTNQIFIYSKNFNNLNDFRDLFFAITHIELINSTITPDINWYTIIVLIKEFVSQQQYQSQTQTQNTIGDFYLDAEYDLNLWTEMCFGQKQISFNKIKQIENINDRTVEILVYCVISKDFFCLYEQAPKNTGKINLTFYAELNTLLSMKNVNSKCGLCLTWKAENERNNYEMMLSGNEAVIESIKLFFILMRKQRGFESEVKKERRGKIPNVDISQAWNEIKQWEIKWNWSGNVLVYNKWLDDYKKVVEYYSAINNSKYEDYSMKIKELLINEKYKVYNQ